MKYQWPEPSKKIRAKRKKLGYYMQFRIRSIEVLTHRHKRTNPCNEDWQNDDPNFIQQVLGVIGCTPPQLKLDSLPICSTKETLSESHKILNYPTTIDLRNYDVPCREIEKLQYEYTEGFATTRKEKNDKNREWFQVRLYFADTTYKYIEQVRL